MHVHDSGSFVATENAVKIAKEIDTESKITYKGKDARGYIVFNLTLLNRTEQNFSDMRISLRFHSDKKAESAEIVTYKLLVPDEVGFYSVEKNDDQILIKMDRFNSTWDSLESPTLSLVFSGPMIPGYKVSASIPGVAFRPYDPGKIRWYHPNNLFPMALSFGTIFAVSVAFFYLINHFDKVIARRYGSVLKKNLIDYFTNNKNLSKTSVELVAITYFSMMISRWALYKKGDEPILDTAKAPGYLIRNNVFTKEEIASLYESSNEESRVMGGSDEHPA